jgi:hypothetical protein
MLPGPMNLGRERQWPSSFGSNQLGVRRRHRTQCDFDVACGLSAPRPGQASDRSCLEWLAVVTAPR